MEKQSSELISVRFALKEAEEKTKQYELSGGRKDSTITALKHELQQLKEEKNKDGKSGNGKNREYGNTFIISSCKARLLTTRKPNGTLQIRFSTLPLMTSSCHR